MGRSTASKPAQTALNHSLAGVKSLKELSTSSEGDTANALLQLSIALLDSALDILNDHLKTDRQLQHPSRLMPGGTPGKHFRHVIEMFQAFLLPLQPRSESPTGPIEIDYDSLLPSSRRLVAKSLSHCRKALKEVKEDLGFWGKRSEREGGLAKEMSRPVKLVALTPTRQEMASSVGRELWFCSLHAIHHFSMLRTIAVHELGLKLPVEFGTAPSTLLYRSSAPNSNDKKDKQEGDGQTRAKL